MHVLDLSNEELKMLLDHIDSVEYAIKVDIYKNISEILNRVYMNDNLIYTKDSPLYNILKRIKTSINPRYTSLNMKPILIDESRYRDTTLSTEYCRIVNRIDRIKDISKCDSLYLYNKLNTTVSTECDIINLIKTIDWFAKDHEPTLDCTKVFIKYIIPHKLEYFNLLLSLNENKTIENPNYIGKLWSIEPYEIICKSFMYEDVYRTYIAIAALLYKYIYSNEKIKPEFNILMYLIKVSQPNIFKASLKTFNEYIEKDEIELFSKITTTRIDTIEKIPMKNNVFVFGLGKDIDGTELLDKIYSMDFSSLNDMRSKDNISRYLSKQEICYLLDVYKDSNIGMIKWYDSVYSEYNTQYLMTTPEGYTYLLFRDKTKNKLYGISINDNNNILIIDTDDTSNYEIISDFSNIDSI